MNMEKIFTIGIQVITFVFGLLLFVFGQGIPPINELETARLVTWLAGLLVMIASIGGIINSIFRKDNKAVMTWAFIPGSIGFFGLVICLFMYLLAGAGDLYGDTIFVEYPLCIVAGMFLLMEGLAIKKIKNTKQAVKSSMVMSIIVDLVIAAEGVMMIMKSSVAGNLILWIGIMLIVLALMLIVYSILVIGRIEIDPHANNQNTTYTIDEKTNQRNNSNDPFSHYYSNNNQANNNE